jgi:hypothetical protein
MSILSGVSLFAKTNENMGNGCLAGCDKDERLEMSGLGISKPYIYKNKDMDWLSLLGQANRQLYQMSLLGESRTGSDTKLLLPNDCRPNNETRASLSGHNRPSYGTTRASLLGYVLTYNENLIPVLSFVLLLTFHLPRTTVCICIYMMCQRSTSHHPQHVMSPLSLAMIHLTLYK